MTVKYLRLAIALLAGLQLAGCYTDYGPVEVGTGPSSLSGAGVASLLQPGEKLKITVYGEETLTGEYDINPAGYVTMPLIGAIRAAGRSQSEFGRKTLPTDISRGGFLQDPHVTVAVVQFKPFYVLGEATHSRRISVQERSQRAYRGRDGGRIHLPCEQVVCPHPARRGRGVEGIFPCGTRADCAWRSNSSARKIFLAGAGPSPPQLRGVMSGSRSSMLYKGSILSREFARPPLARSFSSRGFLRPLPRSPCRLALSPLSGAERRPGCSDDQAAGAGS